MKHNQKTVFITGVSKGIGLATAQALIQKGFTVYGTVRSKKDASKIKKQYQNKIQVFIADVRDHHAMISTAQQVYELLPNQHLDLLYLNAGVALNFRFFEISTHEVDNIIDTNLKGVIHTLQAFTPLMMQSSEQSHQSPSKVMVAGSIVRQQNDAFMSVYTATKHAIYGLFKSLSIEFKLYNIDLIYLDIGYTFENESSLQALIDQDYGQRTFKFFPGLEKSFPAMVSQLAQIIDSPKEIAEKIASIALQNKPDFLQPLYSPKQKIMIEQLTQLSDEQKLMMLYQSHQDTLNTPQEKSVYLNQLLHKPYQKNKRRAA